MHRLLGETLPLVFVAIVSILGTVLIWSGDRNSAQSDRQMRFAQQAGSIGTEIGGRLDETARVLYASRAFVMAGDLNRETWRDFVVASQVTTEYPGLRQLALVERVPRSASDDYVQYQIVSGLEDVKVWQSDEATDAPVVHFPISMSEPRGSESDLLIGLDLSSLPDEREALIESRARNEIRATIRKREGGAVSVGLYLPIYSGSVPEDPSERAEQCQGWVYGEIDLQAFIAGHWRNEWNGLGVQLRDVTTPQALQLFDTGQTTESEGRLHTASQLDVGGRRWVSEVFEDPNRTTGGMPWVIPLAGSAIGAGLIGLTWSLLRARRGARRLAERIGVSLESSEERRLLAWQATNDPIWDWELSTGSFWFNDAFGQLFGDEDRTRDGWVERIHPDDRSRVVADLNRAIRRKDTAWSAEYRVRVASGSYADVLDRAHIAHGENGVAKRVLGAMLDLTERMEIERALTRAADHAEAANASKTEFLANMSHEIRTPMAAILGYTEVLIESGECPQTASEHLTTIKRNGRHLLTIINDILDISKIEAGRMEVEHIATPVRELMADIVSLMRIRASEKGIRLDLEYAFPVPSSVRSDPVRLRQIVMNLVGNAIKFTEEGGVRIIVRHAGEGPKPMLTIEVVDSGIGIDAEKLASLFTPFAQADSSTTRRFGGTGLGLAISKRLAEMLGGDIVVVSDPGRGSSFIVSIATGALDGIEMVDSWCEAGETREAERLASDCGEPLEGWRVLLAEDGPDNQRLIKFHMTRLGASTVLAENGLEAKEKALAAVEANDPFDLILMDMQMPVMDGYEATTALRKSGYSGAIVALTAHAMAGDRERCLVAGCDEYATKPIDRNSLVEAIHRARELTRASQV